MVTVDQNMTITPTSFERDQPAFVFGPNYELHRYTDADEKPGTAVGTYEGEEMEVKFPNAMNDEAVDLGYTKLTGDNVVVQLADLGDAELPEENAPKALRDVNGGYSKLLFANKVYVDRDSEGKPVERDESLPQNLAAGDILVISYKDADDTTEAVIRSKIKEVVYYAEGFDLDRGMSGSDSDPEGGPGTLVTIEDAIPEPVDTGSVKAVLVDVFDNVEFTRKNYKEMRGYQWETKELEDKSGNKYIGVKVNVLYAEISGYFAKAKLCPVLSADLFVTYRELLTAYSDTFHSIVGDSEVANVLGKVDPDNPLAMGVHMAALNSTTDDGDEAPPVYFMAVPTDDKKGYDAVLNKATLNDRAYAFAPTTRDEAVLESLRSHVLTMSAKTVKKWRIAFVSAEVPESVDRLNAAMDPQGDDFLAIPVSNGGIVPGGTGYNKLRVVESSTDVSGNPGTSFMSTVVPGDKVRFNYRRNEWQEYVWSEYTVKKVINNFTLELTDDVYVGSDYGVPEGDGSYVPEKIEVYHPYTPAESAEAIASISKAMASRRMYNVFPSVFENDGVMMTGEFAACAVSGLVSATEPQQPITNVTVRGIDNIPMTYLTHNQAELNVIASGGTFIIAQDLPGDLVYVRHQISTAYPDGNLNTAELSITKDVDSISYAFADTFRPYYGKYNITPDLESILENLANTLIGQFASTSSVYGPQLIADETQIRYIRQNELLKDHLDVAIKLGVPYPCNNIDIVLTV